MPVTALAERDHVVIPLGLRLELAPQHVEEAVPPVPRARVNGLGFVAGWLVGLGIVGAVVLLVAGPADPTSDGGPATWVSVLKLVFGVLLLLVALRQWRSRPHGEDEPATPKWMGTIERFTRIKALGAGALLGGVNPKNLLLTVAAAASTAATGIGGGGQAVAYLVFALIGTVGVAAPVVIYLATGDRAAPLLGGLQRWMARKNAVIMAVLLLVISAKRSARRSAASALSSSMMRMAVSSALP